MSIRRRFALLALLCALVLSSPSAASGQNAQERQGFWIQFGLGPGSLGCEGCDSRENGGTGVLSLGGTLTECWLLGGGINVWSKSENNVTLTVATVTALARFYPAIAHGFFVQGGLGYGSIEVSASGGTSSITASQTGAGATLGLGWDIRVSRNLSLTPFWNGFAIGTNDVDADVGQIGLALTIH